MRRFIIIVLVCLLIPTTSFATQISVIIDNETIEFDVSPTIQDNRVLVPIRKIFEKFNCNVEWIEKSQTVIATQNNKIISLRVGKNIIICTDIETGLTKIREIDVAPIIQNGRTLVPIRVISESLNYYVDWIPETNSVIIKTK